MWPNSQETANLATFTEEILNGKLLFCTMIRNKVIPVIGGHLCIDKEKISISLPTRYGGSVIPTFHEMAETEFINSSKIQKL